MKFEEVEEIVFLRAKMTSKCQEDEEIVGRLNKTNICSGEINHLTEAKQLPTVQRVTQ